MAQAESSSSRNLSTDPRLMREILGFRGIRNLNGTEHANYPAIDLADFGARIAVHGISSLEKRPHVQLKLALDFIGIRRLALTSIGAGCRGRDARRRARSKHAAGD